jgi:hypothetical protein
MYALCYVGLLLNSERKIINYATASARLLSRNNNRLMTFSVQVLPNCHEQESLVGITGLRI